MALLKRSPALPFEIIEHALGYIVHDPNIYKPGDKEEIRRTLCNCMLTCRALVPRSRYLLFLRLYINSHNGCKCLSRRIQDLEPSIGCTRELILNDGDVGWEERQVEWQCAMVFVHQFAHQLLRLELLEIRDVRWGSDTGTSLHQSFFMSLRLLTSVTSLNLVSCGLWSSHELHRVLCALPALTALKLENVWWKEELSVEAGSLFRPYRPGPLRLDSLSVRDIDLDQKLTWFVRTTASTSLRVLSVKRDNRLSLWVLQQVLERLGPSLESLNLDLRDFDTVNNNFGGLTNNPSLRSLTIHDVYITHVPGLLAGVTSAQLSTLTLSDLWIRGDKRMFDRSRWDAILAVLARPVFKSIECLDLVMRMFVKGEIAEHRRCFRRLCQMIPAWLAPLEARGVLRVRIAGLWEREQREADGPFMEGDELALPESEEIVLSPTEATRPRKIYSDLGYR